MDEPRNQSEEPLPGSVSDQNAEEAEPGHGGESGEGSQSTGSPHSAG